MIFRNKTKKEPENLLANRRIEIGTCTFIGEQLLKFAKHSEYFQLMSELDPKASNEVRLKLIGHDFLVLAGCNKESTARLSTRQINHTEVYNRLSVASYSPLDDPNATGKAGRWLGKGNQEFTAWLEQ